jgi:1-acyl-sn-glycerol-3-phosphate acyltransferase
MTAHILNDKVAILRAELPHLPGAPQVFLKSLLFCLGSLVTVENAARLEAVNDPVIFALNHNCSFEAILAPCVLIYQRRGRLISFVSDWMYGRLPGIAWIYKQIDPVYVYNKPSTIGFLNKYRDRNRHGKVLPECLARLESGRSIGLFPEGTRNADPGRLLRAKKGLGYLALESGRPVIPVGIDFPARLQKGKIPAFGRLVLRVGEPLRFEREAGLLRQYENDLELSDAFRKRCRDYLEQRITHTVMLELAGLSGKEYPFPAPVPPVPKSGR